MSKYEPLWNYVKSQEADFTLTYEQIEKNSVSRLTIPFSHLKRSLWITAGRSEKSR